LLHDAVEDQEVPVEMIAREFGKQVADTVMEVTDDKTLPKGERKRKQIEAAPKKSREAKLIKLADKTSDWQRLLKRMCDERRASAPPMRYFRDGLPKYGRAQGAIRDRQ
jgi:(p)ppGpp synthase/HD superfamily hydrolase